MSDVKLPKMQHPVVPTDGPRTFQSAALRADHELSVAREAANCGDYGPMQALPMGTFDMANGDNRGNGGGTFSPDDIMLNYNSKRPSGGNR